MSEKTDQELADAFWLNAEDDKIFGIEWVYGEIEVTKEPEPVEGVAIQDRHPIANQMYALMALVIFAVCAMLMVLCGCGQLDTIMPDVDVDLGIDSPVVIVERPVVNIPSDLRQENWLGNLGEGSCTWASTISLLRWQGRYNTADWVRKNRGNGEWPEHMATALDDAGIRYAYTIRGDVEFLEWACRTRRGCGITVNGGSHMVTLVHLDSEWAAILDNNSIEKFIWVPRESLISEWQSSYGWAVAVLYTPPAPLPQ